MDRFGSSTESERNRVLKEKNAPNTDNSTDVSWRVFTAYLCAKSITLNPATISKSDLNDVLKVFYVDVRKADGDYYKKKSMTTIRFGIQRRFHELRSGLDIINDTEFATANEMFKAQGVFLKKKGLAEVDHKSPICQGRTW